MEVISWLIIYSIISFIIISCGRKLFLARLILSYDQLDKHKDIQLYKLLKQIRVLTGNTKFIVFIINNNNPLNQIFLGNFIYKIFKPNCTFLNYEIAENLIVNQEGMEQLKYFIHSEALFRSPRFTESISDFIYIVIEYYLESIKVFNIILYVYFRLKRAYIDKTLIKYYKSNIIYNSILNLSYNRMAIVKIDNIKEIIEFNNERISGFFPFIAQILVYDLHPILRIRKLFDYELENKTLSRGIPYITE